MESNLKKRLMVAIIGIPFVMATAFFGNWPFAIIISAISGMTSYELLQITSKFDLPGQKRTALVMSVGIPLAANQFGAISILITLWLSFIITGVSALGFKPEEGFKRLIASLFTICFVTLPFSSVILLRNVEEWRHSYIGGIVIIYIMGGIWLADSGAYMFGRLFGKRKLAPNLSPNKTVEGLLGGFLFAITFGVVGAFAMGEFLNYYDRIIIGLIVGSMSVIGDLVESMLKRSAGVKDSGTFFPGHGGMFDRFDSLLFVFPTVYLYMLIRGLIQLQ
jgi:phosphatidate cytidylyltransferase